MPAGSFAAAPLMEFLGQAVIATDLAGYVRYWNAEAERMYGWTATKAVGQLATDLHEPQPSKALSDEILLAVRAGGQWSGGLTLRRKDGSVLSALVTDTGIFGSDGDLVGFVAITGGVGSMLRPFLAHTSNAAVILDAMGRVSHVSPAAARIFGWSDESLSGRTLWELVDPADREDAIYYYRTAVASSDTSSSPLECRVVRDDGSSCWVDLLLIDLLDDPVVRGLVCTVRDITDRIDERRRKSEVIDQLQTALHSRVEIEQAKGLIAARIGGEIDKAFAVLRRYARDHNLKLHELAHSVVTGEIELPETRQPID